MSFKKIFSLKLRPSRKTLSSPFNISLIVLNTHQFYFILFRFMVIDLKTMPLNRSKTFTINIFKKWLNPLTNFKFLFVKSFQNWHWFHVNSAIKRSLCQKRFKKRRVRSFTSDKHMYTKMNHLEKVDLDIITPPQTPNPAYECRIEIEKT